MTDKFKTLERLSEGYYMDRGSKFFAYAFPVNNEFECAAFIQQSKKAHPKARHFCTAWRLNPDATLERSNDDGEPSGSAGKPIMGQLLKNQVTNTMVLVVRYFGGTKLGVPGLIEAYKTSAANAIQNGRIVTRNVYSVVRINLAYEQVPVLINHCLEKNIPVFKQEYNDSPTLYLGFHQSTVFADLKHMLQQFTRLDFGEIKQYAEYLKMNMLILEEKEIR